MVIDSPDRATDWPEKNRAKIRIRAIWLKWPEFIALVPKKENFQIKPNFSSASPKRAEFPALVQNKENF